jgi:aryl-alcohol dehydrogenase-like predicted oxidoreductase
MDYRRLGRSGLKISTLTLGTMTFGGRGKFAATGSVGVEEARRIVAACVDAGVNLIDTANGYSAGLAEEIIGEVLAGRRGDLLIATKARMRVGPGPNDEGFSRWHLIRECEKSLKRLRTDVIDIYFLHEWDGETPLDEALSALDTLQRQGKIRYAGCSNFSGWHIMKALAVAEAKAFPRFVTQQIHYTLEAREAEYELLPIAHAEGLGTMVWSPLAGGLLSGKYGPDTPTARQVGGWNEPPIRDAERLWRVVAALKEVAAGRGVSAAQVALAWLLKRPTVASLVIGARDEAQLADNLAAASLRLAPEETQKLDAASALPLIYPYWHQRQTAGGRLGAADRIVDGPTPA